MTIYRSRLLIFVLALLGSGIGVAASAQYWPEAKECSNINPFTERECIDRRVEEKERVLAGLYDEALAEVRRQYAEFGDRDNRLDPRNFIQAQKDWKRYVDSHCLATGAYGGGNSPWISERVTACHEYEIDRRIELFRQMADGSYGL
jgi:uncharacterized protein YecT (DUF1311 family)